MNQSGDYVNDNITASSPALTLTNTHLTVSSGATAQPIIIDECSLLLLICVILVIFSVLSEGWLQCLFLRTVSFSQLLSVFLLFSQLCCVRVR